MAPLFQGSKLDDVWSNVEEMLISADVGVSPTQRLLDRLKQRVQANNITSFEDILNLLKQEMVSALTVDHESWHLESPQAAGNPLILLMVGINGAGKTTSTAKLARMYQEEGRRVLLGAADTFRAAAIEQLQIWGQRQGVDVVAHQPGADPSAVAFDTLQAARARGADVVIIDTAGRLHTKVNLMEELKKIQRVLSRQQGGELQRVLLTLDATTGQNGLFQARAFTDSLKCDGVFLAKLDGTAKGGVLVGITNELKLPILYIGTGEQLDDIVDFDPQRFVDALFDSTEPG